MISAGRWNPINTPMVYCSDHPATALLEILVHIDADNLPPTYQLLEIEVPDSVSIASPDLTADWENDVSTHSAARSDDLSQLLQTQ